MQNRKLIIHKVGPNARLSVRNSQIPTLEAGEILIKNESCGIAFADILMREGLYPHVPKRNLTPGYDVVGHVVAVGKHVTSFAVGDRVAAITQTGAYAEYTTALAKFAVPCADELDDAAVSAVILNYTTAYQMLVRVAKVKAGDRILVHGVAGGVGSALLELGLQMGLDVYGTLSKRKWQTLPDRLDQHPRFHKIDYQQAPFEITLAREVPQGIDAAFDAIGGAHLRRTYQAVSTGGTVVTFGFSTAIKNGRRHWPAAIKGYLRSALFPVQMISDNKTMAGYGIWEYVKARPAWFKEDLQQLLTWLAEGKIQPLIAKTLPLDQAGQAMALMERSALPGKVVLTMN